MADSIRERIVQAAVAAIDGVGKPTGLAVHRYRTRKLEAEKHLPAMVVFIGDEPVKPYTQDGEVLRTLELAVKTRDKNPVAGTPPDQALDPYLTWLVKSLMADQTLGGLAISLKETGNVWNADETTETVHAEAGTVFEIKYITSEDNPEVQP